MRSGLAIAVAFVLLLALLGGSFAILFWKTREAILERELAERRTRLEVATRGLGELVDAARGDAFALANAPAFLALVDVAQRADDLARARAHAALDDALLTFAREKAGLLAVDLVIEGRVVASFRREGAAPDVLGDALGLPPPPSVAAVDRLAQPGDSVARLATPAKGPARLLVAVASARPKAGVVVETDAGEALERARSATSGGVWSVVDLTGSPALEGGLALTTIAGPGVASFPAGDVLLREGDDVLLALRVPGAARRLGWRVVARAPLAPAPAAAVAENVRQYLALAAASVVLVLAIALFTARGYASEAAARERESYLRRSLDETASNERFLSSLFDAITDVVVVQDTSYNIVRANRVARERYGQEIVTRKCYGVYRGKDSNKSCRACPVDQVIATGKPVSVEMQDPRTEQVWQIADYPLFDEKGRVRMVIEHARDVTQTKRLEAQLVQSEKLSTLGEMAAGVAHEINNPIGVISMYAQLLAEDVRESAPAAAEKVKTIEQHAEHVGGIVKDLLRFSRRSEGAKAPVEARAVIERALSVVEHQKALREVEIIREVEEPAPVILGDEGSLAQVVVNLVVNAAHAMGSKGKVVIRARRAEAGAPPPPGFSPAGDGGKGRPEGPRVLLSVTDTGKGIARKNLKKIFEPFFTTKPQGEGTGLGLSVSFVIVRDHGGALYVDSEEGKGATFTLELPAAPMS